MTESERPRPERPESGREEEPFDVRLTSHEIYTLLAGLAHLDQVNRRQLLERPPQPGEEEGYTEMRRQEVRQELAASEALRQKLNALIESREDNLPRTRGEDQ